jgi:hypothetical protein
MLGRIEGCHLNSGDGFQPLCDGVAHHAVHVAVIDQRSGMAIVRTQNDIAGVNAAFGDSLDLGCHIIPGRTQAQHGAHALTHPGDAIFEVRAFMVVGGATGHIGMEGMAKIR